MIQKSKSRLSNVLPNAKKLYTLYKIRIFKDATVSKYFLIYLLKVVFSKSPSQAYALYSQYLTKEYMVVGCYPRDFATSYKLLVEIYARKNKQNISCDTKELINNEL